MSEKDTSVPRKGLLSRFLTAIETVGNALPHPATLFAIFAAALIVLSWLFSKLGVSAVNPTDGSSVIPINLISRDGLHWILEKTIENFTGFAPLGTVLVAMLGIGVAEKSGLIGTGLRLMVHAAPRRLLTFVIVFAGVMSNMASDIGYVLLVPMGAIIWLATGGIIFGMMSDKWGRVKTMVVTLLIYSSFTGLSGLATSWVDFTVYRFLVGLGVGGMFGAATTLVAESVPGNFRSMALGSLQALSATGNIIGSLISFWIQPGAVDFLGGYSGWRVLFFVGILPALLVIPIVTVLREPEAWKQAKAVATTIKSKTVGSPVELFRDSRWRRNTIVGLCLGVSGMIG